MFGFLFKKQHQIETLIFSYIENFRKTRIVFRGLYGVQNKSFLQWF